MGNHALWQVVEIELGREFEISNLRFGIFGRGCSSVGRAVALQAIGQEFESPQLHQLWISNFKFEISNSRASARGV